MLTIKKRRKFYVFGEHTDYVAECEKMGFVPSKRDGHFVEQFICGKHKYNVYGVHECYSGWEINVVQSGDYTFESLLYILLNSRFYSERIVSLGFILKYYYDEFLAEFTDDSSQNIFGKKRKKIAKEIVKEVSERSDEVSEMKELIEICKKYM